MKRDHLAGLVCAVTLAIALPASSQVESFTVDDFNVATLSSVSDNTVGGAVSAPSIIDGSNIVMDGAAGWTRTLTADLTTGDSMQTEACNVCQAGHVIMTGGAANGIGTFTYSGSAIDMSVYSSLVFDWGSDLPGASVDIRVSDGGNTATVASWSSLAATGGSTPADLVQQAPRSIAWGAVNSSAVTEIQIVVTGVADLDSILDNFTASGGSAVIPTMSAYGLVLTTLGVLIVAGRRMRQARARR